VGWQVEKSLEINEFLESIDLVVVIGGDGSILSACRKIASSNVPLLGINLGRLGFLTDITPDEIELRVAPVLAGEFKQTERFMLSTSITRNGREIGTGTALNDVVLHPGMSVRMMEFELYVDGEFVYSQRSDGLIVATPTGSTAYALSAGGPLICPEIDAMVCVPLNPHTLSSRPIVLHGDSEIEIRVNSKHELHPSVTCDGQDDLMTEPGDKILIKKHQHIISLIHPKDNNFYKVSRSKLGWGSRLGVKKER
jgi:NAD+ kinase